MFKIFYALNHPLYKAILVPSKTAAKVGTVLWKARVISFQKRVISLHAGKKLGNLVA